jgi:hypothetical protein
MPNSYRIRTTPGVDKHINVTLDQDFEFIEILSLKLLQSEIYTRVCSDYGVIVGRVSVNNGYGLPNAKVSIFIPLSEEDSQNPIISELYPYQTITDRNEDGYRYNLLPKTPSYDGHTATGSFPNKTEVLLDQSYVEVYDKYYKFTVKTNDSGDYMIFGVPTGAQTIVMDVDLSDIGCFSLSPQDLIKTGNATESQVDGNKFKSSTTLEELPQIVNFNRIIEVNPLWGDVNVCQLGINRVDFDLTKEYNIKINPQAIFLGSIMSTTDENSQKINCKPQKDTGKFCELIAGPGQILSIRHTINLDNQGLPVLEEHKLENEGKVIDENGAFLVDLPMNLDYITTNEFGEQIISSDPEIGIPTKGRYRFKIKWQNESSAGGDVVRANFLVPNIKEYGWASPNNDPYNYPQFQLFEVGGPSGIPAGNVTFSELMTFTGGLSLIEFINAENVSLSINGNPYFGSFESINVTIGDIFTWSFTPIDITQNVEIKFQFFQQDYFELLKSYAFSLEWDDYVNVNEALNCEDTFYEFHYNKVYTTGMFLDRYKFGNARWMHLGIKEIDDRTCRTENNVYPVNDIIRNQDIWFQLLIFLLNVLTFPIIVLIILAHIVYTLWPLVKLLFGATLIFLGYLAGSALVDTTQLLYQTITCAIDPTCTVVGGSAVFYTLLTLKFILYLTLLALIAYLTVLYFKYFNKFRAIPISLPLLSYPECTNCECGCVESEIDDFTLDDITQGVQDNYNTDVELPGGGTLPAITQSNSALAPLNQSSSYNNIEHPNYPQRPGFSPTDNSGGWFRTAIPPLFNYKSLSNLVNDDQIESEVGIQAILDFRRLFSGSDTIGPNLLGRLHAPQTFLFSAEKSAGSDERWFAFPTDVTYSQKLNEFNTRNKYFIGVNKITTTVNPSLGSDPFNDQIIVVLAKPGTTAQLTDQLITFQNSNNSNGLINVTGATLNQFETNSVTGTTTTGTSLVRNVKWANPTDPNGVLENTSQIKINQSTNNQELIYPNDIEYFQLITGLTVSEFIATSNGINNPSFFHQEYLRHKVNYIFADPTSNSVIGTLNNYLETGPSYSTLTYTDSDGIQYTRQIGNYDSLTSLTSYNTYEVLFLTRGVDPYTDKQEIKYDLSRIFGFTTPNTVTFTGQRYLNVPIQATNSPKPKSHNTLDNTDVKLYHPSYTFSVTGAYSAFTSYNPYYYLAIDDTSLTSTGGGSTGPGGINYKPTLNHPNVLVLSNTTNLTLNNQSLPNNTTSYIAGGTFLASNFVNLNPTSYPTFGLLPYFFGEGPQKDDYGYPFGLDPNTQFYSVYSPAYYRFTGSTTNPLLGVNFSDSSKLVMRSDRIPTSDKTQNGELGTGFGLHQNDNFKIYVNVEIGVDVAVSFSPQEITGANEDEDDMISGITESLECNNTVPLECYEGSGTNLSINQECVDKFKNSIKEGCYCFPTKRFGVYILNIPRDVKFFLEWKTRFTVLYAACRGIFSQTFQNNWINGNLYMFSVKLGRKYFLNPLQNSAYDFCDHNVIFNEISNSFYYRSSPYNQTFNKFIGSQRATINLITNNFNGSGGFNDKQIQFPTTITDLGPRDAFINQVCGDDNLQGYLVNQIRSTSYRDTSDIVKVGFLSRLINGNFIAEMIAKDSSSGWYTEGTGIFQFFNSSRGGYRIDGDFAQALSINSEFKTIPFATDTYPNNFLFFGQDNFTGGLGGGRAVFGVFYSSSTEDVSYRRRLSPGTETFNQSPLIQFNYGYPNTQTVPHYRWKMSSDSNYIFGTEDNNWDTAPDILGGFYTKKYQDMDYITDPYFKILGGTMLGYITKFDSNGTPNPSNFGVSPGLPPSTGLVSGDLSYNIVGAPYHFYFGLKQGATAINKFITKYLEIE